MGMDVIGTRPTTEDGKYFRANVWSWRPIHWLIMEANARFELGLDIDGFDTNSGDGLVDQSDCDRLASALETLIAENPCGVFTLDIEPRGTEALVMKQLVASGWQHVESEPTPYGVTNEHLQEFIVFLRSCGGFEIW